MSVKAIANCSKIEVSEVRLKNLFNGNRLDAECYQNEYLATEQLIRTKNLPTLKEQGIAVDASAFYPSIEPYYNTGSMPFLRVGDIKSRINYEGAVTLPNEIVKRVKTIKILHKGDIVLTKGGTIANVGLVEKECAASRDLIILKTSHLPSEKQILLFFYLRSKIAQSLILRTGSQSVQAHLTVVMIRNLPAIDLSKDYPFESELLKVYENFLHKDELSVSLYHEAVRLLLEDINLEGYQGTSKTVSVRNFSEALAANRFDAEYWQPKYDEIERKVLTLSKVKLGDIVSAKKGVEVGSDAYSEEGMDFIRVSDFTVYGIGDVEKKISNETYRCLEENYRPKKGEVLFTKDGTIGISFAVNEDVNAIVSGAFMRLKPKVKINTTYLALVLNSFYCKSQIERMSGGAVIAHLKPENVMQINIPIMSEAVQNELAGKVSEALRLQKETKGLIEAAKRAVEIIIESNEKDAIRYLKQLSYNQ